MESVTIAIIGANGVGKSTFVQRVLDLNHPPSSVFSTARMSVDSGSYLVTLLELGVDQLDLSPGKTVRWPKHVDGQKVPRIDSALLLYDVMTRETIRDLPKVVCMLAFPGQSTVCLYGLK